MAEYKEGQGQWSQPELSSTLHRGIVDHSVSHNKSTVGVHWTTDPDVAKRFATSNSWFKTGKVFTAEVPISSLESNPDIMKQRGFAGFGGKDPLNEKEVMVKEGAPVKVTKVTKIKPEKVIRVAPGMVEPTGVRRARSRIHRAGKGMKA